MSTMNVSLPEGLKHARRDNAAAMAGPDMDEGPRR